MAAEVQTGDDVAADADVAAEVADQVLTWQQRSQSRIRSGADMAAEVQTGADVAEGRQIRVDVLAEVEQRCQIWCGRGAEVADEALTWQKRPTGGDVAAEVAVESPAEALTCQQRCISGVDV